MRAYTTISYNDLSLEELVKFGKKAPRYLQGRDNGLLYNGKMVLPIPNNSDEFNIQDYLERNLDIINCGNDLNKFIDIINDGK